MMNMKLLAVVTPTPIYHKALPAYVEGGAVFIEFTAGHPDMLGK